MSAYNVGDLGSIPGSGRSPGEGNGLQYSCLENPMDGGVWWATVHGVAKSWTRLSEWLNVKCMAECWYLVRVKVLVTQSPATLCDPTDYGLPGSSIHGILQARIPEWVAISFPRGSSWRRDRTGSPTLQADALSSEPPGKPAKYIGAMYIWRWWGRS